MIGIAIAFLFGLATTVYLSLRSPEVKVPDVVGKNRFDAEKILADADLNFRVRAIRPSNQSKPDTVLFQLPRPGEVVKTGQTVAMDISRAAKEGETPETVQPEEPSDNSNSNANTETNLNENKPRKPRNKNANDNLNANANGNANVNRPANANRTPNANRPNVNGTPDNTNTIPRTNINRTNANIRTNINQNENRRPVAPRPSPSAAKPN
ncbi:MAG TPA: PASTA domain-containing protein [Pyrinomonadaceae bacterium]|nr:PASTA domain-containing protein [Pyrinomonadaceae bacterium]